MSFDLSKCNYCGECLERCKYTTFDREQGSENMKALVKGQPARIMDECVTCWACNTYCPTGANPADLILLKMEEKGYKCSPALIQMVEMLSSSQISPSSVKKGKPGKPIFNVCVFYDVIPDLFQGKLFEGGTFLIGGEYEANLAYEHIGRPTSFKEVLARKIRNIAKVSGENEVVFMHDDSYVAVTAKAEEFAIDVPFKPVHQAEYFRNYLKKCKDRIKKLDLKIAYQLPCTTHYIPLLNKWIDEVMELIGCERVGRTYDRDNQICCGGLISSRKGAQACQTVRTINIEDAKTAGAEAFIMHCHACAIGLREMANASGMKPYMLTELVRLALGETVSGPGAGLGDNRDVIKMFGAVLSGQIQKIPF